MSICPKGGIACFGVLGAFKCPRWVWGPPNVPQCQFGGLQKAQSVCTAANTCINTCVSVSVLAIWLYLDCTCIRGVAVYPVYPPVYTPPLPRLETCIHLYTFCAVYPLYTPDLIWWGCRAHLYTPVYPKTCILAVYPLYTPCIPPVYLGEGAVSCIPCIPPL